MRNSDPEAVARVLCTYTLMLYALGLPGATVPDSEIIADMRKMIADASPAFITEYEARRADPASPLNKVTSTMELIAMMGQAFNIEDGPGHDVTRCEAADLLLSLLTCVTIMRRNDGMPVNYALHVDADDTGKVRAVHSQPGMVKVPMTLLDRCIAALGHESVGQAALMMYDDVQTNAMLDATIAADLAADDARRR